jgi:hypothetical protein
MAMDGPDHIAEGNGGGSAWIGKVAGILAEDGKASSEDGSGGDWGGEQIS